MSQRQPTQDEYNIPHIQRLLTEAVSDEDLTAFCYDHFRPVYQKFTVGTGFRGKVQLLVDHCHRNNLFAQLLALIESHHPGEYTRFEPQLKTLAETLPKTKDSIQDEAEESPADFVSGVGTTEVKEHITKAESIVPIGRTAVDQRGQQVDTQYVAVRDVIINRDTPAAETGPTLPNTSFWRWALAIGAIVAALGIISVAADSLAIWDRFLVTATPLPTATASPTPLPTATSLPTVTPLAFEPATDDEILILVATFHRTAGVVDTDARNEIRRTIETVTAELGLTNLRVGVEPTILTADERTKAEALGEQYGASMIIWGAETGVRITVNFLNLKEPDFVAAEARINEIERTQLANPSAYASFITTDLPGQVTFLSFFAVGQSYLFTEDYPAAISTIEKAIDSLAPDTTPEELVEAYFRLGWLYHRKGTMNDVEQAILNYSQAIELNHNYVDAYYNRGNAYFDSGTFKQAILNYTQVIERQPTYTAAYFNRGLAYGYLQNWAKAIEDYDRVIEDYGRAIEGYGKVIELKPNNADAYYNRGLAYTHAGRFEQAILDFNKAIELKPAYAEAYYNRGIVYFDSDDLEHAIGDYTQAIAQKPNDADAYFARGRAYFDSGDLEFAIDDYTKAIALEPTYTAAYFNRGLVYERANNWAKAIEDYDKAIEDYSKVIELEPNDADAYYNRGLAYTHAGRFEKAILDFNKVIELKPTYVEAYYYRGLANAGSGYLEEAFLDLDKVIELKPTYVEAYLARGFAHAEFGIPEQAILDLERYLELTPDTSEREEVMNKIKQLQSQLPGP